MKWKSNLIWIWINLRVSLIKYEIVMRNCWMIIAIWGLKKIVCWDLSKMAIKIWRQSKTICERIKKSFSNSSYKFLQIILALIIIFLNKIDSEMRTWSWFSSWKNRKKRFLKMITNKQLIFLKFLNWDCWMSSWWESIILINFEILISMN